MNNCTAAIFIPSSLDFSLLEKNVAGIPLLKRLILTLNRVGIKNILAFGSAIKPEYQAKLDEELAGDFRFNGNLIWLQENQSPSQLEVLREKSCLAINGNTVTTKETLKAFIETSQSSEYLGANKSVQMKNDTNEKFPLFLLPADGLSALDLWAETGTPPSQASLISITSDAPILASSVENISSWKEAEREFISLHRFHYRQLMDIKVNSFFSLRISSFLAKTTITPNQISIIGLVIGLFAGYEFSRGDYLGGLLGSILLVFTAIWDCCDGDIARLKFMESDFGETLDTACDNIINVFMFTGMMLGLAKTEGWGHALIPFFMIGLGGGSVFALIYFPSGGKGFFFKGTPAYNAIQLLASRNFIYIVLLFGIAGKTGWFLWLAGFGSLIFALELLRIRLKIKTLMNNQQKSR